MLWDGVSGRGVRCRRKRTTPDRRAPAGRGRAAAGRRGARGGRNHMNTSTCTCDMQDEAEIHLANLAEAEEKPLFPLPSAPDVPPEHG